jgi:hypothetical protein
MEEVCRTAETMDRAPTPSAAGPLPAPAELFTSLPGPSRKRTPSPYCYRLTYRNPEPEAVGCALLWDVFGGRLPYQVALERQPGGSLRWHCTCADAVYRGEYRPHVCKHVRGLQAQGRRRS